MPNEILQERIRADLNSARKSRDKLRTLVLTTFLSEIRNREIEVGGSVENEEVERLLTTAIKRRREAAEQMRAGGRPVRSTWLDFAWVAHGDGPGFVAGLRACAVEDVTDAAAHNTARLFGFTI